MIRDQTEVEDYADLLRELKKAFDDIEAGRVMTWEESQRQMHAYLEERIKEMRSRRNHKMTINIDNRTGFTLAQKIHRLFLDKDLHGPRQLMEYHFELAEWLEDYTPEVDYAALLHETYRHILREIGYIQANVPGVSIQPLVTGALWMQEEGANHGLGCLFPDEDVSGGGEETADELLPAAVDVVLETGQASVSMLQRRLKLGYFRAARLVDQMESRGIVGPFEGSKPRRLLITKEQWQAMQSGNCIDKA